MGLSPMGKVCCKCNKEKILTDFYKCTANKDGLQNKCKFCGKIDSSKQYKNNPKRNKELVLKWNKNNPKRRKEFDMGSSIKEGYGVYTLTHLPTQCYYVGEGLIRNRRHSHFHLLKKGINECKLLQKHYDKYPDVNCWEFQVIRKWDRVNKDKGKKIETKLIKWGLENVSNKILNKKLG